MVLNLLVENLDGLLLYYHLVAHSLKIWSWRTWMKFFQQQGVALEVLGALGGLGDLGVLGDLGDLGDLGVQGDLGVLGDLGDQIG